MQTKNHLVILAVLLVLTGTASATEYYVDAASGNDSNPGTETQPWLTFQRALPDYAGSPIVGQGDTVHVASGDYGAVNYNENGDTGRTDWITYIGNSNKNSIIRQLQIRYTTNAYMKFYNFSIYEAANPGEFDRSLEIVGTNATTNRANKIEFYGCYIRTTTVQTGLRAVYIKYADDIVLEDCEIDGGDIGLLVADSATNITVTRCHFHDQWGDIVDLYGTEDGTSIDNVVFDGCLFEDLIWLDSISGNGDHMDYYQSSGNNNTGNAVNDVIIRNCRFKFTYNTDWDVLEELTYVGIQPQAHGVNFTFENNLLYGLASHSGFKFSIKVADKVRENVIIRNNTFGVTSTKGYFNILTNKLTGVQNHNNIYHTGFQITTAPEEVTQGNNIYNSYGKVGGGNIGPDMDPSSIVIGQAGTEDLFVDFNNNDFHLKENSAAVGFGSAANATATDIEGNSRDANPDAGAYEFQGTTPCTNGIKDSGERGVDCGGSCPASCTFYVSPTGNDSDDGTIAEPWQTLAKAASIAEAGDTVLVRAGTYNETMAPANSGTAGKLITFKAYPDENVAIEAEGKRYGVELNGKSYIRIEGFEIRNSLRSGVGIWGDNEGIEIVGNNLHSNSKEHSAAGGGIIVRTATDLLIQDNEIHYNEGDAGIFVQSNTEDIFNMRITGNYIHDNIDGIKGGGGGNWLIEDNIIGDHHDLLGTGAAHPDGMQIHTGYLNGVIIRNNILYDASQLIYVANMYKVIENVEIYGNIVYEDDSGFWNSKGIFVTARNGIIKNVNIYGNTVYGTYTGIIVQGNVEGNVTIRNNILSNIASGAMGVADIAAEIDSNYNLIYNGGIKWKGDWYNTLALFQTATGLESKSFDQDPEFVDPASFDFHLQPTSPAINAGDPALGSVFTLPSPFLDIDGTERPQGTTYDIGAYEFRGTACIDTPALLNYISQWKQGQTTMLTFMGKIALWKAGTGCSS